MDKDRFELEPYMGQGDVLTTLLFVGVGVGTFDVLLCIVPKLQIHK